MPDFAAPNAAEIKSALTACRDETVLLQIIGQAEETWQQNWITWIDRNVIAGFPESPSMVARWLCHEIAQGRKEPARILRSVVHSYTFSHPLIVPVWEALARYAYWTGSFEEGDQFKNRARVIDPNYSLLWCEQLRALALIEAGRTEEAIREVRRLYADHPGHVGFFALILEVFHNNGDFAGIVTIVDDAGGPNRIPDAYLAYLYFGALEADGQLERCFVEAQSFLQDRSGVFLVYHLLRTVAHKLDQFDAVEEMFFEPLKVAPQSADALEIAALAALDRDYHALARTLYRRIEDKGCEPALRLKLTLETTIPGATGARKAYLAYRDSGVSHAGPEIQYASFLFNRAARPSDLVALEVLLADAQERGAKNVWYHRLFVQVLVALGRRAEAEAWYAARPTVMKRSAAMTDIRLCFEGDVRAHDQKRAAWAKHFEHHFVRSVHSRTDPPAPVRLRSGAARSAMPLFSCLFNAMEYLPWFLDAYRALGVDQFFLVDNGSTDGSADYLSEQPDVSLFSQPGSFKQAAHGVVWINRLLQDHALGKWAFFVDMDELFVFPGQEDGAELSDLLTFADAKGYGSFPSFMLDLFATSAQEHAQGFAGHCHFENDYLAFPSVRPPYRTVQGGIRARMTGRHFLITKSPLVTVTPEFRFTENNHTHSHLAPADVTTALLHYKFIGDANARIAEAIDRQEHFMAGRFYKDLERSLDGAVLSKSRKTKRYKGPRQLERLGLMSAGAAWPAFHRQR